MGRVPSALLADQEGRVLVSIAEVRVAPSLDSKVDAAVAEGESVTVIKTIGEWCRVRIEDGKLGWILTSSLDLSGGRQLEAGAAADALEIPGIAQPFVNSLGMKFTPVPITGGPTDGKTSFRSIWFCVWETRRADYARFATESAVAGDAWQNPVHSFGSASDAVVPVSDEPLQPVVMVSPEEAEAFCAWLTERDRKGGKIGPQDRYRLPSDHEWSCAAGIGTAEWAELDAALKDGLITAGWPWGKSYPWKQVSENYQDESYHEWVKQYPANFDPTASLGQSQTALGKFNDGAIVTAPVGSYAASTYGLFDLGGNVAEICTAEEWTAPPYTVRGNSWLAPVSGELDRTALLCSNRRLYYPGASFGLMYKSQTITQPGVDLGFRCVLEKQQSWTGAIGRLHDSAEDGNVTSMEELAAKFWVGDGVARSPAQAFEWWQRAAAAGSLKGKHKSAFCLAWGVGVARNAKRAFALQLDYANEGDRVSANYVANCYTWGVGVSADPTKGSEWKRRYVESTKTSAESGNADAQVDLAVALANGDGVPVDMDSAFVWYGRAADQGSGKGFRGLGVCYWQGDGTTRNLGRAFDYFTRAIAAGETSAMTCIAELNQQEGDATFKPEPEKSKTLWLDAAKKGSGVACRQPWGLPTATDWTDPAFPRTGSRLPGGFVLGGNTAIPALRLRWLQ